MRVDHSAPDTDQHASSLAAQYRDLELRYSLLAHKAKKHLRIISLGRLVCFLSIIPAYYFLLPVGGIWPLIAVLLLLVVFVFLVKLYAETEKRMTYFQRLVEINRAETGALARDFSPFGQGDRFGDLKHDYALDLDLFGRESFFQFMNRTATVRGEAHLAGLLGQSYRAAAEIRERQVAIDELTAELDWRQDFLATGKGATTENDCDESVLSVRISLRSAKFVSFLLATLPAITLLLIGLSVFSLVDGNYWLIPVFVQWMVFAAYGKTITKFGRQFGNRSKMLRQYVEMLSKIERKDFKSTHLAKLRDSLWVDGKPSSAIASELQKILDQLDYRQNLLVGFVLNSALLWDVRCLSKLNAWQQAYSDGLPRWFGIVGEIDALLSLANYNYNHQHWAVPVVADSGFVLKTSGLGHPLIDEKRCIRNPFSISGAEQIVIVTGANMAGKSTFLRTVGINLVLASNGCRTCADAFEFSPVRIFSNMRVSDNLMNDESYFYAELLRLQTMLELIRKGENLFVIIDEMLKGTNSVDKLNGSKQLVAQLVECGVHGIVATHDLGLTELAQSFPSVKNQCFEVQLGDNELTFDYRLTDGVTRTMNATFLMKKMGIIPMS